MSRMLILAAVAAAAVRPAWAGDLETVAELDLPPGNVTVTPDGRIILSLHQFFSPADRVVELRRDGRPTPFPNEAWNRGGPAAALRLDSVLGLRSDENGVVWLLDNGMRDGGVPKLVAWDTRKDRLARIIHLPPPATVRGSFVNDLQVDLEHEAIYIADPAGGANAALIVVDLRTGAAHRLLEGHESVVPEEIDLVIDGRSPQMTRPDGSKVRPRIGVNPIALDVKREWLYFGPMSGTWIYRVRTADLLAACRHDRGETGPSLAPNELARRIEKYAQRPISDGASIDRENNLYITDLAASAIGVIDGKDRKYRRLFTDVRRLSWPDAFSFGPGGELYVVSNQLHLAPPLNDGRDEAVRPFYVLKFTPLAPGAVGH